MDTLYLTYCILVSINKQMGTSATFNYHKNDINTFLSTAIIEFTQSDAGELATISALRNIIRKRREELQISLGISAQAITKDVNILIWKLRLWAHLSQPENEDASKLMAVDW
jgi:hypothetical protein